MNRCFSLSFLLYFFYSCSGHAANLYENSPVIVKINNVTNKESNKSVIQNFEIVGKNQNLKTSGRLEKNRLILGGITVENWPTIKQPCLNCNVKLDRNFHPDGPTIWLNIKNNFNQVTWVVSSYQKRFVVEHWKFLHDNEEVTLTDLKSKKVSHLHSISDLPIELNSDNECSLLWAHKEFLVQPGSDISLDVAQFKSQFIIQCDDTNF